MRVLIVSEFAPYSYLGGLAKHAINLGNTLQNLGHEVSLMGDSNFNSPVFTDQLNFNGKLIFSDLGWNLKNQKRRAEKYFAVTPSSLWRAIVRRLTHAITTKSAEFDVIHYHGHFPILAASVPSSVNLVVTHHDFSLSCPNKIFFRADGAVCEPRLSNTCDSCYLKPPDKLRRTLVAKNVYHWREAAKAAIKRHKHVFVSARLRDLNLAVLGEANAQVSVIHNFVPGADLKLLAEASNLDQEKDERVTRIFMANNLEEHKGIRQFLEVASGLNILDGRLRIRIAGHGTQRPILQKYFKGDSVEFLGQIPHAEVIKNILQSDVYVLPSLWEESCSTGVLEALFLNKDVRALNRGGTPELARYESYPGQLTVYDSMSEMVGSFAGRSQVISENSVEYKDRGYCVESKAKELIDLYRL